MIHKKIYIHVIDENNGILHIAIMSTLDIKIQTRNLSAGGQTLLYLSWNCLT